MTTQVDATSVTTAIDVEAPIEHAFRVFTEGIGSWWNPSHHILEAELAEMVFEPFVGGHIIDRGTDGSECRWARVLAYDPPASVCFSWDISLNWQLETDPAKASEIEVTFTSAGQRGHGWCSPTATSTVTATAGKPCETPCSRAGASRPSRQPPLHRWPMRRLPGLAASRRVVGRRGVRRRRAHSPPRRQCHDHRRCVSERAVTTRAS